MKRLIITVFLFISCFAHGFTAQYIGGYEGYHKGRACFYMGWQVQGTPKEINQFRKNYIHLNTQSNHNLARVEKVWKLENNKYDHYYQVFIQVIIWRESKK